MLDSIKGIGIVGVSTFRDLNNENNVRHYLSISVKRNDNFVFKYQAFALGSIKKWINRNDNKLKSGFPIYFEGILVNGEDSNVHLLKLSSIRFIEFPKN